MKAKEVTRQSRIHNEMLKISGDIEFMPVTNIINQIIQSSIIPDSIIVLLSITTNARDAIERNKYKVIKIMGHTKKMRIYLDEMQFRFVQAMCRIALSKVRVGNKFSEEFSVKLVLIKA